MLEEVGRWGPEVHQDLTQLFRVQGSRIQLKVEQVARAGLQQPVEPVELVVLVEVETMVLLAVAALVTARHLTQLPELLEIYTLELTVLMDHQQQLLTHRVCDTAAVAAVA